VSGWAWALGAAVAVLFSGCLEVADERARRDERIGQAQGGGLEVRVDDGLAAVHAIGADGLTLWAQAPALTFTLVRPPAAGPTTITIANALADAALVGEDGVPLPAREVEHPRPTLHRWVLAPGPARVRLFVRPPDVDARDGLRFAVYADVQERIGDVQDIYARMNQDPRIRFALMSGDLTQRGTPAQLARFQRELETLAFPVYATLGNHELGTRDDLFHDHFGRGSFSFTFRGARFTLLDSASATIAPAAARWLDGWLAAGAQAFHVVAMHIPPLDPVGLRNGGFASRLEANALVARLAAAKVDLTVYGHVHSYYAFSNAGIPAYITGGGGAIPERLDGIGRHFLTVDVEPTTQLAQVAVVRVD
jgi:hypothetical protein